MEFSIFSLKGGQQSWELIVSSYKLQVTGKKSKENLVKLKVIKVVGVVGLRIYRTNR